MVVGFALSVGKRGKDFVWACVVSDQLFGRAITITTVYIFAVYQRLEEGKYGEKDKEKETLN